MKSSVLPKIKRFFTYNWKAKIISLIFAGILCFYVNSLDYKEETVHLPINYENLSNDLIITETSDESINLKIRARQNTLKSISFPDSIIRRVDLKNAIPGTHDYKNYGPAAPSAKLH